MAHPVYCDVGEYMRGWEIVPSGALGLRGTKIEYACGKIQK